LNSGEAQREYMNIQSNRFSAMQKRYQNYYPGLASKTLDKARQLHENMASMELSMLDPRELEK